LTRRSGSGPVLCFPRREPLGNEVFDSYWRFAAQRQAIFFRRIGNEPPPWTDDEILLTFRFTNAYRASDRVSQYLIRHVIYAGEHSLEDQVFRIVLFKLFNKIETWQLLESQIGPIRYSTYRFENYDRILTEAMFGGTRIYSSAYIMPSGGRRYSRKHQAHLRLLERMMLDNLPKKLAGCRSMGHAFAVLRAYPMIGDFLAYQYVTDLNYSEATNFSEMEFVVPGPGARSGIRKCFPGLFDWTEEDVIRWVTDSQEAHFSKRQLEFRSLWGRPLQLVDCQNLFCEIDKYSRVRFPEICGQLKRKRIKRRFQPNPERIDYWFPPKWGINVDPAIDSYLSRVALC
jgi:alpha-glutamyl/putrescinyl thymine pyrophosphorylase clade 1